jgi:hypothetical protein
MIAAPGNGKRSSGTPEPGQVNAGFCVIKVTRPRERIEHQLRFELFNPLNHPQFGKPGSTLGASGQGVQPAVQYADAPDPDRHEAHLPSDLRRKAT